jgi:RNA polymerase sigma-B factor
MSAIDTSRPLPHVRPRDDGNELSDLFRRWQQDRDPAARERLVERFMPLARKLARRYLGANEPYEDLVQVASVGLLLAIDRFDHERGTAFSTFAVPTILGELRRYFRDLGWALHVPRATQERALKIDALQKELLAKHGRSPSIGQLAQALEWSIEDVLVALEAGAAHHASSLQAPADTGDDERGELLDRVGTIDEHYDLIDASLSIAAALERLPVQERRVLEERIIGEKTQSQIGAELGVSQMHVSRLQRESLRKVREMTELPE